MLEHRLLQQVCLVQQKYGMDALSTEVFHVGGDGAENAAGVRRCGDAEHEANLSVKITPPERRVVRVRQPKAGLRKAVAQRPQNARLANAGIAGHVISTFLALVRGVGIHPGRGQRGPRIHDLRHTFAVRSLEQCAGNGEAVARHMLALSTYLGHAHLFDTYWYLQATPRVLVDVAARSEALARRGARRRHSRHT